MMMATGLAATPMAALSRAVVGARGSTLIINLPGSPKGVVENLEPVLGVLPHALDLLAGGHGSLEKAVRRGVRAPPIPVFVTPTSHTWGMEILIVIALAVVACLLVWNIAQHRSNKRESRLQQRSEDTVQAVLDLLGRDRQDRRIEARALTEKTANAAALEAARMAKAELETQSRSSADLLAQQQRTFSRTAEQIGDQLAGLQRDLASRQGNWSQQFGQVNETLAKLGGTTESLTHMLSSPGQKGSWGGEGGRGHPPGDGDEGRRLLRREEEASRRRDPRLRLPAPQGTTAVHGLQTPLRLLPELPGGARSPEGEAPEGVSPHGAGDM